MRNNRSVDVLAGRLSSERNRGVLSAFFKRVILKKFEHLALGLIEFTDGDKVYSFGDRNSEMRVNVRVLSPEFYVLLGSGGLVGAAEAYTSGFWETDELLLLIRIVLRNKEVLGKLESGWSKILDPLNIAIHWNRKNSLHGSKENILAQTAVAQEKKTTNKFVSNLEIDPVIKNMSKIEIKKIMEKNSLEMTKSAEKLDFYEAARLRDENIELMKIIENKS